MKKISLYFLIIFASVSVKAQINLVPNFSFEDYSTCPNAEDQIQYSNGWDKYSSNSTPTNTTPDYYNSCSPDTLLGIPTSIGCYQQEHRNCNAYAGLCTWGQPGYRECIGIQLTSPLVIGQKYFISFYTVMGEDFILGTHFGMPSNNIGLRLSTIPYTPSNPVPIDNFAHLNSATIITDSTNWQRISGSIVADSAYQYVILGNFFDDTNTDTLHYSCGSCINAESYYLIDDICVSTDSLLANGGIDALSCSVSVPEINSDIEVHLYPNPATDAVTISFQNYQNAEIVLTDICGKNIYSEKVSNKNSVTLSLYPYSAGIYFLKIINQREKKLVSKKIIKF